MRRSIRTLAVLAATALVVGAFMAGPADAKKKKCPKASFVEPASPSASRTEVPKGKVTTVTDKATAEAPLVIEYEHGPALWDTANQEPIMEDTKWFNIQVDSAAPAAALNVRQEWPIPSVSDMDLYLWDGPSGAQVAVSGAFNAAPVPVPGVFDTGGMGWESVSGLVVGDCAAVAVESRAFMTAGEAMTLKVWLDAP